MPAYDGRYCRACGEQRVSAHDYSILHFAEHAVESGSTLRTGTEAVGPLLERGLVAGAHVKQKDTGAKKRALCAHLRDAGMVHTLEQPVYEEMLDRENAQLERIALRATTNPHFNAAVETQKKRIAAMEAAWVKYAAEHFEAEEVEAEDASAELSALVKAQAQAKPPKVDRKVTVAPAAP